MSKLAWTPWHQVVEVRGDLKSGELSLTIFESAQVIENLARGLCIHEDRSEHADYRFVLLMLLRTIAPVIPSYRNAGGIGAVHDLGLGVSIGPARAWPFDWTVRKSLGDIYGREVEESELWRSWLRTTPMRWATRARSRESRSRPSRFADCGRPCSRCGSRGRAR